MSGKKYPAHELLLQRLDETVRHANDLHGDLLQAGEFADTATCVLTILNLLGEVIIPEEHLDGVIQSLEQIREKSCGRPTAGVLAGLIDELNKDRKP